MKKANSFNKMLNISFFFWGTAHPIYTKRL